MSSPLQLAHDLGAKVWPIAFDGCNWYALNRPGKVRKAYWPQTDWPAVPALWYLVDVPSPLGTKLRPGRFLARDLFSTHEAAEEGARRRQEEAQLLSERAAPTG